MTKELQWDKLHQPCPCGKSSDAYCSNSNGSGKCFSCDKFFKSENGKLTETSGDIEARHFGHRGLSTPTMRFYDIKTRFLDGEPFEVGFKYPSGGVKVRNFHEKKFRSEGDMKSPGLFGRDKFDAGSKDSITITAGEYDAPSIYEATRGRTAAVSLRSGNLAQAMKDCIHDRDYINSFKRIIFALDNDQIDQKTANQLSSLFDFNKVYHVRFEKFKDANDYFQHNAVDELEKVWAAAKRYSPDNIISEFGDIRKALRRGQEATIGTYPFSQIQSATYGLHEEEIVTITAVPNEVGKSSSGVGKTELFRAIQHHLLKTTNVNIGIIHLEEDTATTIKALAGYELGVRATVPDCGLSEDDMFDGYLKAVGNNDNRVHIYTSIDVEDEQAFLDNIRFMAVAGNCKVIFFDHITWLGVGTKDGDTTGKLDRISQALKSLARELKFCLVMISHTNDDGRTRGSRNIEFVTNTQIVLTRDKEHPDMDQRNTVYFSIPKVRLGGQTGPAGYAVMDVMTGVLREPQNEDQPRMQLAS